MKRTEYILREIRDKLGLRVQLVDVVAQGELEIVVDEFKDWHEARRRTRRLNVEMVVIDYGIARR